MSRSVSCKCPYCGVNNDLYLASEYSHKQIVTCDVEIGGCDKSFVAYVSICVSAEGRKIEGEEGGPT